MAQTVEVPDKPPVSWLYERPEGYVDGSTLTVDYDGSLWGEPGRVCGLVQPPSGRRYIGGGSAHGHRIPERYPDETFSDAHVGTMQFTEADGSTVQRQVASIAVEGGHSSQAPDFAVLAESGSLKDRVRGAVDWLQRRGKYAHLANELGVYGRITRVQSGPAKGALIFNGAAYPWLTKEQAMAINATTCSSEQWGHPDHGGRSQFIGVARVHQSSYRNDIPAVLADLGDGVDPMGIIEWIEDVDTNGLYAVHDVIAAEVAEPEFNAQTARIDALDDRFDRLEALVASLAIVQSSGEEIGTEARLDSLSERQGDIENLLADVRQTLERLTRQDLIVNDDPTNLGS